MERTAPLNERQLEILRLIGDGNDLSGSESVGFRNTARALQSRGLVTVSKVGGRSGRRSPMPAVTTSITAAVLGLRSRPTLGLRPAGRGTPGRRLLENGETMHRHS